MKPQAFDPKKAAKSLAARLTEAQPGEKIIELPVKTIGPDPDQHRRYFDKDKLEQLGASIKASGQELPIIVRPKVHDGRDYMIVSGERRWRAVQLVGLKTIKVIVRQLSDADVSAIVTAQAAENWQREGLTVEESVALATRLVEVHGGLAQAVEASGKPKTLLSKLTSIGKAGDSVRHCLTARLCEDIETLYRLSRAAKKDGAAVDRLVRKWDGDEATRSGQRAQVDALLAKIEAAGQTEDDPGVKPGAKNSTEIASLPPPKNRERFEWPDRRPTSSETHGEGVGSGKPDLPPATAAGTVPVAAARPVAHAQRQGDASPTSSAAGASDSSPAASPALYCNSARFEADTVEIETPAGVFKFDRASLADVLGVEL